MQHFYFLKENTYEKQATKGLREYQIAQIHFNYQSHEPAGENTARGVPG